MLNHYSEKANQAISFLLLIEISREDLQRDIPGSHHMHQKKNTHIIFEKIQSQDVKLALSNAFLNGQSQQTRLYSKGFRLNRSLLLIALIF